MSTKVKAVGVLAAVTASMVVGVQAPAAAAASVNCWTWGTGERQRTALCSRSDGKAVSFRLSVRCEENAGYYYWSAGNQARNPGSTPTSTAWCAEGSWVVDSSTTTY